MQRSKDKGYGAAQVVKLLKCAGLWVYPMQYKEDEKREETVVVEGGGRTKRRTGMMRRRKYVGRGEMQMTSQKGYNPDQPAASPHRL